MGKTLSIHPLVPDPRTDLRLNMFKWLNKQGVQSDSGFIVQRMTRFTFEYREGDQKLTVYVEDGFSCVIIGPKVFEKWDLKDGTKWDGVTRILSIEKQQEMLANFTSAIKFMGMRVVVENGFF